MSMSNKSEDPIEFTQKEEELHHQVEKLDVVPEVLECVSACLVPAESRHSYVGAAVDVAVWLLNTCLPY